MKTQRYLILTLTALLIAAMAAGTFVEQTNGHEAAAQSVYHAPWFIALWGALTATGIAAIIKWKMWQNLWTFLLHISLILILFGALASHFTARQGTLHIRQGETAAHYFPNDTDAAEPLPFALKLDTFFVSYTTGTGAPRDFESRVRIIETAIQPSIKEENPQTTATVETSSLAVRPEEEAVTIRMNSPLALKGYRFYQTSFDSDRRGTILTVAYDPIGLPLTYAAYALLGLSMMGVIVTKWRKMFRKKAKIVPILATTTLFLTTLPMPLHAKESVPTVNAEQAAKMERLQVSGEDRVMPLGTLARDFLLTVYGATEYRGLTATQVLAGWTLRPDAWKNQPMILVKNAELRERLGIKIGKNCSFASLFAADGTYRVEALTVADVPETLRKSAMELDEKVGLILMATRGELVRPAPTAAKVSEQRVTAELLYNRLPHTFPLFIACCMLSLLIFFIGQTDRRVFGRIRLIALCHWALFALTLYHTALYALRWYIGGRIPLGNGPETMLFMALCLLWLAVGTRRRQPLLTAPAILMAGFTLLVAHLSENQPHIGGLMPVLQSPLLTIHVSIVMTAYALLALTCILSATWLFTRNETLTQLSHHLLLTAVFLLAGGIFIGAVWAGVSWGTYWSWDPKEVWALITLLVYALPIHARSLPIFRQPTTYHIYMTCAFLTVLFTYFGVNYVLGGMHSYA